MEIVINRGYGGFGLSEKACEYLGLSKDDSYAYNAYVTRTEPKLIECIKALGEDASSRSAHLKVVTIPEESTDYCIENYDGAEIVIYVIDGKIHKA